MVPHYNFDDFLKDCAVGITKVFVNGDAMKTAESDFNLKAQEDVLKFIEGDGLEKPSFINSTIWRKNPNPEIPIMIDAWSFFAGLEYGYIAFRFQPKTNKWTVKSFKKNTEPDPRNLAFKSALQRLAKPRQEEE